MASTYIYRNTNATANSGYSNTWTFSAWVKRATLGAFRGIFMQRRLDSVLNSKFRFHFDDQDRLGWECKDSGGTDDSSFNTNMKFRDTSGWYHIVLCYDSTQATAANRIKLWVNGIDIRNDGGGFSSIDEVGLNFGTLFSSASRSLLGVTTNGSNVDGYHDGSMSHVHFCYDNAYQATDFGEYDANGVWKIKTSPSVTYGSQGFFILKNGNSTTDQSGQGNNLTADGGTLTNTEDCPSNVFATVNILSPYATNYDFYNGNTTVENDGSAASWTTRWGISTLGMSSGKFYAEAKIANIGTNQMYALGLVKDAYSQAPSSSIGGDGIAYYSTGGIYKFATQTQTVSSYTTGDIIGLAFDATNGTAQWYKNGSAVGTAETGLSTDGTWFFVTNQYSNGMVNLNYGNGYFGTTAVTSAGTNASGNGIFEYDVPTGYTALSTKGLNL